MRASNPAPDLARIARQIELSWRIDDVRNAPKFVGSGNARHVHGRARRRRQICPRRAGAAQFRDGPQWLLAGRWPRGHRAGASRGLVKLCRSRLANARSRRGTWRARPAGNPCLRRAGTVRPRLPGIRHAARAAALAFPPDRCLWYRGDARRMAASACIGRMGRNGLRLRSRRGIRPRAGQHTRRTER